MKFRMISAEDLKGYMDREDILLLDLRDKRDYDKEHIYRAVWVDWEQLENQMEPLLQELGTDIRWIILYCERGNTSLLVARDLARLGYPVMSLNGGYLRWKKAEQSRRHSFASK